MSAWSQPTVMLHPQATTWHQGELPTLVDEQTLSRFQRDLSIQPVTHGGAVFASTDDDTVEEYRFSAAPEGLEDL